MLSYTEFKKKDFETAKILKELVLAHRYLAQLKREANILPNQGILLSNVALSEATDSSKIENIVATQDSLYKHSIKLDTTKSSATKEVHNYSKALFAGWKEVKNLKGISINTILKIQKIIEPKKPGFRKVPGTVIKNITENKIIYTPPSPEQIPKFMHQLENFINKNSIDPLIKMPIIHHWFESIHPFYDGNGRTGRIINILFLLLHQLLDTPILYLSRYILKTRQDYYKLLQQSTEEEALSSWIIYMLKGVTEISQQSSILIKEIAKLFTEYKQRIRTNYKFYSHELINNIFTYPYTKSKILEKDMSISRVTASRYLQSLAKEGILEKKNMDNKFIT